VAENLYSVDVIAKLLNLTERRVQQLAKEGIIPKAEKGKYNLVAVVKAYVKYLQDLAFGKHTGSESESESRSRWLKAKAALSELELSKAKGEVVSAVDVADWWDRIISAAKVRLLAIPTKAAPLVIGAGSLAKIQDVIQSLLYDALNELSSTNPIAGAPGNAGVETTPEIDSQPVGRPRKKVKPRKLSGTGPVAD